jgi:DNA-binding transcriptional LysR family regulator
MINLHHLSLFHAVAETGSISRAAERLLISQPAVSKQLGELERNIGIALFDRLPRGVRMTEAGRLLQGYANRIFSLADDALIAVDAVRGVERGRLCIGATTTLGVYLLPDVLVSFRKKHPGVQISLEISHTPTLASWLSDGAIDLAITESPVEDDRFQADVLMHDALVVIAAAGHPLSRKRSVTIERLCDEPFVVRETSSTLRSMVERALAEQGLRIRAVCHFL